MAADGQSEYPFFIYNHDVLKKEEDDPNDAIIYFYPHMTSISQRVALCGQLMGMVRFYVDFAGAPPLVYRLRHAQYVLYHDGIYTFALGGDPDIPVSTLKGQLDCLYKIFTFYHRNITDVLKLCTAQDRDFSEYLSIIWDTYIPYVRFYGDEFLAAMQPLQPIELAKGETSLFLKASHLLEMCQRVPGVLSGCLLLRNKVLSSQLTPSFTARLCLIRPQQKHLPCRAVKTHFTLPVGVRLLSVYLTREEYTSIKPPRAEWPGEKHLQESRFISSSQGAVSTEETPTQDLDTSNDKSMSDKEKIPTNPGSVIEVRTTDRQASLESGTTGSDNPVESWTIESENPLESETTICDNTLESGALGLSDDDSKVEGTKDLGNEQILHENVNDKDTVIETSESKSDLEKDPSTHSIKNMNITKSVTNQIDEIQEKLSGTDEKSQLNTDDIDHLENEHRSDLNTLEGFAANLSKGILESVLENAFHRNSTTNLRTDTIPQKVINVENTTNDEIFHGEINQGNYEETSPNCDGNAPKDTSEDIMSQKTQKQLDNVKTSSNQEENFPSKIKSALPEGTAMKSIVSPPSQINSEVSNSRDTDGLMRHNSLRISGEAIRARNMKTQEPKLLPLFPLVPATKVELFMAVKAASQSALNNLTFKSSGDGVDEMIQADPAILINSQDKGYVPTSPTKSSLSSASSTASNRRSRRRSNPEASQSYSENSEPKSNRKTNNVRTSEPKVRSPRSSEREQGKRRVSGSRKSVTSQGSSTQCNVSGLTSREMEEMDLYIQGNADLLLILIMEKGASQHKDAIQALWKGALPQLGEMDLFIKQRAVTGSTPKRDMDYNYLMYNSYQRTLKGNMLQPVSSSEHSFSRTAVDIHGDFEESDDLTDVIFRSNHSYIYGHRAGKQEIFFHQPNSARHSTGLPDGLDQKMAANDRAYQKLISKEHALII